MEYKKTAFKTRTSWITKTFFLTIQESFFFFLILWTFWFLILVLHSEIFFCCCCILCIYAYTESVHRNIARDIFPKRQLLLCVAYCFYHYLGFTISFLDLGYPTEQEKPLTTSGSMVYSSSNPPNISTVTPQDHRMGRE